ncbi:DUF930 domain-containing protein [Flaviflagellibacter deserti]
MVQATTMLAQANLARPQSRQAVKAMSQMVEADRIDQLCAIEASEQIEAWKPDYRPDRLVSFAMSDTREDGDVLVADGAAFRSKRNWYHLRFRCGLSPDHAKVVSFAFEVGDAIPRDEWEPHNLAAIH